MLSYDNRLCDSHDCFHNIFTSYLMFYRLTPCWKQGHARQIWSMRFVFHVRENMPRWKQALIFLFTAVIGLIMNEIILWLAVIPGNPMIGSNAYILQTNIGKIISVIIVAIWNFIARKKLLE